MKIAAKMSTLTPKKGISFTAMMAALTGSSVTYERFGFRVNPIYMEG